MLDLFGPAGGGTGVDIRESSDRFSALFDRFLAKFVDYLVALSLEHAGFLLGSSWLAWLAATAYLLMADGLPGGRSLGKRLAGLQVTSQSGEPCSLYQSTLRNSPVGLAYILGQIPWVGWILGLAVVSLEGLLLVGMRSDKRFGDDLAGTVVKKVAGRHLDPGISPGADRPSSGSTES